MIIENHTDLLNYYASTRNLTKYLEIGVQKSKNNFDKIKCPYKIGVDPDINSGATHIMESDTFFKFYGHPLNKLDLIFIDGLHTYEQVKKDFENSLTYLSDKGIIVIHDCLPQNEPGTRVPRETKVWWGDVYKLIFDLPGYNGIAFQTYNIDHGCCVVWKSPTRKAQAVTPCPNYDYYLKNKELMNILPAPELIG